MTFIEYSKYYNLLYADKNYKDEANYICNLIDKNSTIEVNDILNLGCGTGNHDLYLSVKGYKITGIDLSENMINIAKSRNIANSDFLVSDIRTLNLEKQFDCIISLFHVASYQTTNQDLEQYFETAYKHLKPNGIFIFDFWYGPAVLTDKPTVRIKRIENEDFKITRLTEPKFYENENIVDVNFEILIEDKILNKINTINETHKMRYLFLPELMQFIEKQNFKIIAQNKWKSDDNLSFESWNGVLILKK